MYEDSTFLSRGVCKAYCQERSIRLFYSCCKLFVEEKSVL